MSKFEISIFSPDGIWTVKEIKEMIKCWFKSETKKGIAYKVIFSVKELADGQD